MRETIFSDFWIRYFLNNDLEKQVLLISQFFHNRLKIILLDSSVIRLMKLIYCLFTFIRYSDNVLFKTKFKEKYEYLIPFFRNASPF